MGTTNTLDLNNRVDKLEKAVSGGDSAQANKSDIATEFSATTNYTAGCFVYYGGKLYQFNADHSAGAWDPTDAVEANVTDQVVSNAAAIEDLTATDVAYDNTASGLTATDVQGAVDEVKSGLMNLIVSDIKSSATTQSVAGASNLMFTIDVTKQEYTPIFYTTINTTNSSLVPYYYALNGNTLSVAVHNFDSNAHDGTVSALVLYKHS